MKKLLVVLLASFAFTLSLSAETFVVDRVHSEATFQVRHMMSKVTGRFADFEGVIEIDRANPSKSSVKFTIKAASIDTSVADRDKDLRSENFFFVEKYPEITFASSKVTKRSTDLYEVTGTLTMRGVSKQITLPVSHTGFMKDPWGIERAGFSLTTTLNRKDYGINWNKALDNGGVLLGDDVTVSINIEAKAQPPAKPANPSR
jgi:polyisoprenoid-binding protein YceI